MNTLKPKEEHMIILSMIAKDHTQTEIARKLNTTGGNISQKVKVLIKYGLLASRRTLSERGKDAVLAYKMANNRANSQKPTPNPALASSMPLNASRPQPVALKPQMAQQAEGLPQAQTTQAQMQQQALDKQIVEVATMLVELVHRRNAGSAPTVAQIQWMNDRIDHIFSLPENHKIVAIAEIKREYNKSPDEQMWDSGKDLVTTLFKLLTKP